MRRIDTLSAGIGSPARRWSATDRRPLPAQRSSNHHLQGGRLQIGMADITSEPAAGFSSESVADFARNQQIKRIVLDFTAMRKPDHVTWRDPPPSWVPKEAPSRAAEATSGPL